VQGCQRLPACQQTDQGAGEQDLRAAARRAGMFSMREDGERWVRSGATAPEEILRVTRDA